jgi:hypothetical protein
MAKISKKEINHTVTQAVDSALEKLKISSPSKKTKKVLGKVSKKVSSQLKKEVKKQNKKRAQEDKKTKKMASSKKAKTPKTKVNDSI